MRLGRAVGLVMVLGGAFFAAALVQQVHSEEKKESSQPAPGAAETQPQPTYKPVAPVHDLMEAQEHFFSTLKKQLRAKGNEDFAEIRVSANVLAELCNVNRLQKDKPDYLKWATDARDASLKLAEAAKAKDATTANALMREIHTACTACHDKYQ